MCKRIAILMLCAVLLLNGIFPVYAVENASQEEAAVTEITISTTEEFLAFAEDCRLDVYSQNLIVTLKADIDLNDTGFAGVPIFSGVFHGEGHTISGLMLEQDGSAQGLFRYLTAEAVVENLKVEGTVSPGGSRSDVGGIAGRNEGGIFKCSFSGTVSGSDDVGGIVGANTVTGIIENCRVEGKVYGEHFVGGIAGENKGVIRSCTNNAQINAEAQENTVQIADITLDTLTSSEAAGTVTDIGGIAGTSSGVIRSCSNRGRVGYRHMGYNIGGIAGTQTGYIVDCQNYGDIQGRKEVGGIVGQMEPVSLIEYTKDTLQILQGQLNTMSGLVDKASGRAQNKAGEITNEISILQDHAKTAQDAVNALVEDLRNPDISTEDAIVAAKGSLNTSLQSMSGTMSNLASAANSTLSGLTRDFEAISNQLNAMTSTIKNAKDNLGGTVTDISDEDNEELLTGKVANCVNEGDILGDLNTGGIAGAIALENDLDVLEELQVSGEDSMNFKSEVRSVIISCTNEGQVTGKRRNAGGIVGWQYLGLVKDCKNTGILDAEGADYVGGISGHSTGFIRECSVKCEISGNSYVGGIAGSASIATNCRSMTAIEGAGEKLGAVLGHAAEYKRKEKDEKGKKTEEEKPVSGNYYQVVSTDLGAIDGISYAGMAEPLETEAFLALENLPSLFRLVRVRFIFADGTQRRVAVVPGEALEEARIPRLPAKKGYTAVWEGLEETDLSNIEFNMTFEALYTKLTPVLQTAQTRDNGKPILLAEGAFTGSASAAIKASDVKPTTAEKGTVLEVWEVTLTEPEVASAVHVLVPQGMEVADGKLLVGSRDGSWRDAQSHVDGSYLVCSWGPEDQYLAVVEAKQAGNLWIAAAGGVALVALLAALLLRKKNPQQGK